ncbi:MAG: primosomal protein N' [bacterium]|nr:primosomal protein N' [bacterium]
MIVGVLVEISNKSVDRIFDYKVPQEKEKFIKIGLRVEVPFGHQKLEGFVLEIKENSNLDSLKEIIRVIDEDIVLNDELIKLGKFMKEKTLAPLISCYQVMLPKALKAKNNVVINKKYETFYKLNKNVVDVKLNSGQQEIVDMFKTREMVSRKEILDISSSSLNTLVKKNILVKCLVEKYRTDYLDKSDRIKELTLEQQKVVDSVNLFSNDVYLLHGVTGSGKTEVYIKLIEKVLNLGKTAIMLVPEISLTPQMVSRFEQVFGNKIAALHSALSDGEKYDEWRRIVRGEVSIVIGARSAVFAPLTNIGIIIIDEEHSDSYKQDNNPRYNAKDIAIERARNYNCPVLMGSATPSLDTYARAVKKVYKLLNLPNRVNGKDLPHIDIVDMNEEMKYSKGHFSKRLLDEIKKTVKNKEQVILLLNRRGYSSFVSCKNCSYTMKCPNCDISLTYHKSSNMLRCHYCGYGTNLLHTCPSCGENSISTLGVGTEKIEEELNSLIEDAKILRMDVDTTSKKGMHKKMITAFKNHEYDILLGTQIVAKGLDFPLVTLVGVINADTSLNIPDFRSSENTFDLLCQTSGRSGRSKNQGKVIIQTFNKDHYAIKYSKEHDYIGFFKKEMDIRRKLKYPPYYFLCYLKISGKDDNYILNEANKIKRSLERNLSSTIILGPSPATVFKINNIYRYGIIMKYKNSKDLYDVLKRIMNHYQSNNKVVIDIDFNPIHF